MTDPVQDPRPKKGLSTGAKVALGCLLLLVLMGVAGAVALGVGGFVLKQKVEELAGFGEDGERAQEIVDGLAEDHPFERPADGVVSTRRAERYAAVTERAWSGMREWTEDLVRLRERSRDFQNDTGTRPTLGDLGLVANSAAGLMRSRVALAEALEAEGMSLVEYTWIGSALSRAAREDAAATEPEANRALAVRYRDRLLAPSGEAREDVLGGGGALLVATLWVASDPDAWGALGLDTLVSR